MPRKIVTVLVSAGLLLLGAVSLVQAWPDLPPARAYISGPGLQGQVQITDSHVLEILRLGGLEDFGKGALPAPQAGGQPYKIIRYFEGGSFQMGDLTYYMRTDGAPGVVYFQDGPMINGDRTPFNNQWFATVPQSDQILQQFIHAASNGNANANASAAAAQNVWLARNIAGLPGAIAFDTAAQRARFILPSGLRSADGKQYWAAYPTGGITVLHSFDLTDGSIRDTLGMDGKWDLGAISATGKWLALKRVATAGELAAWTRANTWHTTVAVIDTESLKLTRTIALDGNFDVDALDAKGSALYLIQHLPAIKPDHYQVRRYNLALGELQEGALVDKRNIDEEMAGYPWDAVASADGQWLFTLYVGMRDAHAFIHALNVQEGYSWCIDLPSGSGDPAVLEHYALALAPDGHTVYASNAALGVVAIADVMNIGEPRVVRFASGFADSDATDTPVRSSIVAPDGKRVFMSDAGTVWQYDVAKNQGLELKRLTIPIIGLAMDTLKNQLLLAHADHSISAIDLTDSLSNAESASFTNEQNKSVCAVTQPPAQPFVPPSAYPAQAPYGDFWYGTEKLWTSLRPDGKWYALPHGEGGYTQKVFWWRNAYVGTAEPQPALTVTGKRLDGDAPPLLASGATNAYHSDFGGWAMLTGVDVPTYGCWELTGKYGDATLSFVVRVAP